MINDKWNSLSEKKQKWDARKPIPFELARNLDDWFKIELTYTSNALEGNTLTRQETALVVEKGLTVNGKSLKEHLEAVNHARALDFLKPFILKKHDILSETLLLDLRKIILSHIDDAYAGRYRTVSVRIAGSTVVMLNPVKVPLLMKEFFEWFHSSTTDPITKIAADAHYKLVSIHPFIDGNGRTARLIMNVIVTRGGYPPIIIRNEDRKRYLNALEQAQLGGSLDDYYDLIIESTHHSLDIYLDALDPKEK